MSRKPRGKSRRSKSAPATAWMQVERLEDRITPTITAFLDGTSVHFSGDAANGSLTLTTSAGFLQYDLPLGGNFASNRDLESTHSPGSRPGRSRGSRRSFSRAGTGSNGSMRRPSTRR